MPRKSAVIVLGWCKPSGSSEGERSNMSPCCSRPVALFCRQVKTPVLLHLPIFPAGPETAVSDTWKQPCDTPRLWPSCSHNALWARIGLLTCLGSRGWSWWWRGRKERKRGRCTQRPVFVWCYERMLSCVHICSRLSVRCVILLFIPVSYIQHFLISNPTKEAFSSISSFLKYVCPVLARTGCLF